jgi:hypothetical protein
MQHHRCAQCRNPIRGLAIPRQRTAGSDWYHADCWVDVCYSQQQEYEASVRAAGLPALLAPYACAGLSRPL